MDILPEPLSFLWDDGNIDKNFKKHKVTIQEAEEMFINEPYTIEDLKHTSIKEKRFHALGKTKINRKLFAAFTIRNNKVRIISIRDMSRKEREAYEKLENNSWL